MSQHSSAQNSLSDKQVEQLVADYMNLVRQLVSGYHVQGADADDFVQEGLIGLYDAIKSYAPDRGAGFKTYAAVCIKNRLNKAYAKQTSGKQQILNQSVQWEDSIAAEGQPDPELLVIAKENISELNKQMEILLSSFEKQTLSLYLQGYSYKELADRLGVPKKSVDNALVRIRSKLKFLFQN